MPVNVTLFRNKDVADVIGLKGSHLPAVTLATGMEQEVSVINRGPNKEFLIKRENCTRRHGGGCVTTEERLE